jgi:hypothetical protein
VRVDVAEGGRVGEGKVARRKSNGSGRETRIN